MEENSVNKLIKQYQLALSRLHVAMIMALLIVISLIGYKLGHTSQLDLNREVGFIFRVWPNCVVVLYATQILLFPQNSQEMENEETTTVSQQA